MHAGNEAMKRLTQEVVAQRGWKEKKGRERRAGGDLGPAHHDARAQLGEISEAAASAVLTRRQRVC